MTTADDGIFPHQSGYSFQNRMWIRIGVDILGTVGVEDTMLVCGEDCYGMLLLFVQWVP
jgi:hypothetical protein